MDNDASQPNDSALTIDGAAQAIGEMLEPSEPQDEPKVDTEIDPPKKRGESEEEEAPAEPNAVEEGDDAPITITVDGKQITLTKAELAEAYKGGLRQEDATKKWMAAAETKRTAEAEIQKAQAERVTYAQNLTKMAAQLEGAIQGQQKIDWNALLEADPVEYLKQQHLFNQRQAALNENQQEQAKVAKQFQAEAAQARESHLATQQQELLAKLPAWKDETKAATEKKAIAAYLQEQGYKADELNIEDHRAIVLSRKAMLYDQMMTKAQAAAKRVANVPTKVERPGTATERNPMDGRNAAMQRHAKTGSVESAAAVFAGLL